MNSVAKGLYLQKLWNKLVKTTFLEPSFLTRRGWSALYSPKAMLWWKLSLATLLAQAACARWKRWERSFVREIAPVKVWLPFFGIKRFVGHCGWPQNAADEFIKDLSHFGKLFPTKVCIVWAQQWLKSGLQVVTWAVHGLDEKNELEKLSWLSEWKQMILMDKNPASQLGCKKKKSIYKYIFIYIYTFIYIYILPPRTYLF